MLRREAGSAWAAEHHRSTDLRGGGVGGLGLGMGCGGAGQGALGRWGQLWDDRPRAVTHELVADLWLATQGQTLGSLCPPLVPP